MDSTLISDPHHLFAYSITDGLLDEMRPEQRASIISVIECLLSEGEYTIRRVCYREKTLRRVQKKKIIFFLPVRPNNSLFILNAKIKRFK